MSINNKFNFLNKKLEYKPLKIQASYTTFESLFYDTTATTNSYFDFTLMDNYKNDVFEIRDDTTASGTIITPAAGVSNIYLHVHIFSYHVANSYARVFRSNIGSITTDNSSLMGLARASGVLNHITLSVDLNLSANQCIHFKKLEPYIAREGFLFVSGWINNEKFKN